MTAHVIVVGFDGSDHSISALRWSVEEARTHGSSVQTVTVAPLDSDDGAVAALEDMQQRAIDSVLDRLPISREVVRGDPVEAMVDLSMHASLVVLGRHGTSSLIHAGLGSVADACARLCHCPVVVVPPHPPETGSEAGVSPEDVALR